MARCWIRRLKLAPHPEGGFYREVYRCAESITGKGVPARYRAARRAFSTAIYFLLEGRQYSRLHKLKSDELWHFHDGDPVDVFMLTPNGDVLRRRLGLGTTRGEAPQVVFPAGYWFGGRLAGRRRYALVSCTVAPGFDFADFELGRRTRLLDLYPSQSRLIRALTSPEKTVRKKSR